MNLDGIVKKDTMTFMLCVSPSVSVILGLSTVV